MLRLPQGGRSEEKKVKARKNARQGHEKKGRVKDTKKLGGGRHDRKQQHGGGRATETAIARKKREGEIPPSPTKSR